MSDINLKPTLKIALKYKDLEASFEGTFSEVWKFSNEFLKGIHQNIDLKSINSIITTKNKSVSNIIIELRNICFFDEPKSSQDCFTRFKELGKTDITPESISMALQRLVQKGELKRQEDSEKPGKFVYTAPYIE